MLQKGCAMRRATRLALGLLAAGGLSTLAQAALADGPPGPARDPYAYAPPPEQLFYNWSGFYAGALLGGATSRWASAVDTGAVVTESGRANSNDFAWGGQAGYQHQFRDMVLGVEVSYTDLGASAVVPSLVSPGLTTTSELKSLLHINGKIGYAYMNYLFYGKGGYALGSINTATSGTLVASSGSTAHGWMAGLGVSYALHRNIILSAEYNYTRVNADNLTLTDGVTTATYAGNHWDTQQAMLRLDFKLGH